MKKTVKILLISAIAFSLINLTSCKFAEALEKIKGMGAGNDTSSTTKKKGSSGSSGTSGTSGTSGSGGSSGSSSTSFSPEDDEFGDINWSYDSSEGYHWVYQTNYGSSTKRGAKLLDVPSASTSSCFIVLKDQSSSNLGGMGGYISCLTRNKNQNLSNYGTYNFIVSSIGNRDGSIMAYISAYYNISESDFNTSNYGAPNYPETEYVSGRMTPYEVAIMPLQAIDSISSYNNELSFAIKYQYYNNGDVDVFFIKNVSKSSTGRVSGGTAFITEGIDASTLGRSSSSPKGKTAVFANIYVGKTLNAEWTVY